MVTGAFCPTVILAAFTLEIDCFSSEIEFSVIASEFRLNVNSIDPRLYDSTSSHDDTSRIKAVA